MEELIFTHDEQNALPMAKYMKDKFPFAGVPAPARKKLEAPFLKASRSLPISNLLEEIRRNYAKTEREYQYYAIDLALRNIKRLTAEELAECLPLLGEKTWWDSVDAWRKVYSDWVKLNLDQREEVFNWFFQHENFWYRRVAINLQLQFKEKTDLHLLEKSILADQDTDEFFIQKAIGWSLREYSKTDAAWVRDFFAAHPLSKLAVKEGSKYL